MATADSKTAPRKFFSIYKSGQGKYVRFGTVAAMAIIILTGAAWLVKFTPLASISDIEFGKAVTPATLPANVIATTAAAVAAVAPASGGFSIPADVIKAIVVVIWIGLGALLSFWIVNKPNLAEFMIMTESEMRKVTWPTRVVVINSTKVVIFLTLLLGMMLWMVDVGFIRIFEAIGILKH